jgi:hypothetical protein
MKMIMKFFHRNNGKSGVIILSGMPKIEKIHSQSVHIFPRYKVVFLAIVAIPDELSHLPYCSGEVVILLDLLECPCLSRVSFSHLNEIF